MQDPGGLLLKRPRTRTFTPPSWDLFRATQNDNCRPDNIPIPISPLPVQKRGLWQYNEGGEAEDIRHKGKIHQAWCFIGVPTEHTQPPIRDGVPHNPNSSHTIPLSPPGPPRPFSLTTKSDENRGKKALSEHFDNKSSIWPAAPNLIFSNG